MIVDDYGDGEIYLHVSRMHYKGIRTVMTIAIYSVDVHVKPHHCKAKSIMKPYSISIFIPSIIYETHHDWNLLQVPNLDRTIIGMERENCFDINQLPLN